MTFASTNKGAGGTSAVILDTVTGPGAIDLGTGALVGGTSAVIRIGDGAGTANSGGTAAFTYAGTITSGTGLAIDIQDRAAGAGNITLSGNITHNVGGQIGILMDDNAAGTITFSGASKSITSTTAAGVSLSDNAGATINFTNGGLVDRHHQRQRLQRHRHGRGHHRRHGDGAGHRQHDHVDHRHGAQCRQHDDRRERR